MGLHPDVAAVRLAVRRTLADSLPPTGTGAEALARFIEANGWVLDFETIRGGRLARGDAAVDVPAWLAGLERAWAGAPLIHKGRLVGLVVLEHPPYRRPLDWEDFDLLRAAGIQAASYIAEARSQQALADARRFDEFNRRFAFILHDIKNLVSQLTLVARNAERHADNPEFRADMIATLQSSVAKMNDLLARLSPTIALPARPGRRRPDQRRHQAPPDPDQGGLPQRHRRGQRHRGVDQRRPPPPGHRQRGPRRARVAS